jgi:prepilin-type N-terminal cleavage/methylation domain-containing protein
MQKDITEKGVTLIELLVAIAIFSMIMAGVYGLLNSAYQTYLNTRRRTESQQTARTVMDYLVYRLREIDGGKNPTDPWNCKQCHKAGMAIFPLATAHVPCPEDVTIPHKTLNYTLETLSALQAIEMADIPSNYTAMSGNKITFIADMLPLHGFSESFTDNNGNDTWDWTDNNPNNGVYDYGEVELLEDINENSEQDFFGETWSLQMDRAADRQTYMLVESLAFTPSIRPFTIGSNGKLKYNKSDYDDTGYTNEIVAEGIISLSIAKVPKVLNPASSTGFEVEKRCQNPLNSNGCHGSSASGTTNIYGDAKDFDMSQFVTTHPWWNIRGFSIDLMTAARKGGTTHITTLKQFVIPRNIEINK